MPKGLDEIFVIMLACVHLPTENTWHISIIEVLKLARFLYVQLISGVFEHSMLRVLEIYALGNVVFHTIVYGPYKP